MPTVKVELAKGRDKSILIKIRNSIMNAVVQTLQLPENDRNIRIIEHDTDLFTMKPPYEILIEINLFAGRTNKTKQLLYKSIVNTLNTEQLIPKENILITLIEQPLENWAGRGGISADDINLGFKINV